MFKNSIDKQITSNHNFGTKECNMDQEAEIFQPRGTLNDVFHCARQATKIATKR